MPIVSRIIDLVTPQRDGSVRVREMHTDALSRTIYSRGSRAIDLAAATVRMNARDLTGQLRDLDTMELLAFTEAGNDPETFDLTGRDITVNDGLDFLLRYFATHTGEAVIRIALWIVGLPTPKLVAIRDRLGLTVQQGNRILARAQKLADAAPTFDQTEVL